MSARGIDKVRVGFAPLSQRLHIYRHGKDPRVALEKRDATGEIMAAVVEYLLHDMPDGASMDFSLGDQHYVITIKPAATPTPRAARREVGP